jgi:hypothetical protein
MRPFKVLPASTGLAGLTHSQRKNNRIRRSELRNTGVLSCNPSQRVGFHGVGQAMGDGIIIGITSSSVCTQILKVVDVRLNLDALYSVDLLRPLNSALHLALSCPPSSTPNRDHTRWQLTDS